MGDQGQLLCREGHEVTGLTTSVRYYSEADVKLLMSRAAVAVSRAQREARDDGKRFVARDAEAVIDRVLEGDFDGA